MIERTMQLMPGIGARAERGLWARGLTTWDAVAAQPELVPTRLRQALGMAVRDAAGALADRRLDALAARLPTRETWRLWGHFADQAVCLDIEVDRDDTIACIGLLCPDGPRVLLGTELAAFPDLVPPEVLLVTYNGAAFDLPILERYFPDWRRPAAHLDLKPVWARLGHVGGLKALEDRMGIGRPHELRGIDGFAAANLYRHARLGDRDALRRFVLYNLYDAVNLRTLAALAYNQLAAALVPDEPPAPVSYRGDVLYDISKILLAL